MAKCLLCGKNTTFAAMRYYLSDSTGTRTKNEICQDCNAKLVQNSQKVLYDEKLGKVKVFDVKTNSELILENPTTNKEAKLNGNTENKENIKKAKKSVFIKYYPLMTLMLFLMFPIMDLCKKNDVLYLFYIYVVVFVFYASFVVKNALNAGGTNNNLLNKFWWVPAVVFTICFVWFTWVSPQSSVGSEYSKAGETFDSWVNTDPNTWTDAQKDYFNDVMNYEGK